MRKVAEEKYLKPGKIIYTDIVSQKKPGYIVTKNWILIQDSDTKKIWSFFTKSK